jgi:DNA adenine methylase
MAEPILKWAGGKRQILENILSFFPYDYKKRTFHEPMIGAGAVTFAIEPRKGTINDINPRLMRFYKVVKAHPKELIEENHKHKREKKYYNWAVTTFNTSIYKKKINPIKEASLLLYLNRTCYNGLFRVNAKGEFNVPMGGYKTVDFWQEDRILAVSKILKKIRMFTGDFEYILHEARPNDIVYFDPPYHPLSLTEAFTAYSKEGFNLEQQKRLSEIIFKLDEKGVFFVLSNSDVPIIRKLYGAQFYIQKIRARRAISCNGAKRGKVGEILITNVPENKRLRNRQTNLDSIISLNY